VLLRLQGTTAQLRQKLEAIGFGVFIPVFFVTSGIQFDLAALSSSPATILRVPLFLVALLLVRGVSALLYRPLVGSRRSVVAGLLQATSPTFIVAASQIGVVLGLKTKARGGISMAHQLDVPQQQVQQGGEDERSLFFLKMLTNRSTYPGSCTAEKHPLIGLRYAEKATGFPLVPRRRQRLPDETRCGFAAVHSLLQEVENPGLGDSLGAALYSQFTADA